MKRILYFIASLIVILQISEKTQAQLPVAYSPVIDSLINLVNESTVGLRVRQLSGDTTVLVAGETKSINTRNYQFNSVQDIAAQFVLEKFQEYGYQARY